MKIFYLSYKSFFTQKFQIYGVFFYCVTTLGLIFTSSCSITLKIPILCDNHSDTIKTNDYLSTLVYACKVTGYAIKILEWLPCTDNTTSCPCSTCTHPHFQVVVLLLVLISLHCPPAYPLPLTSTKLSSVTTWTVWWVTHSCTSYVDWEVLSQDSLWTMECVVLRCWNFA